MVAETTDQEPQLDQLLFHTVESRWCDQNGTYNAVLQERIGDNRGNVHGICVHNWNYRKSSTTEEATPARSGAEGGFPIDVRRL